MPNVGWFLAAISDVEGVTGVASRFGPLFGVAFYIDTQHDDGVRRRPIDFKDLEWYFASCSTGATTSDWVVYHRVKSPMHALGCSLAQGLRGRVDVVPGDYLVVDLLDQVLYAMNEDTFSRNFDS